MANINPFIEAIQNAVYGEEVRSAIMNALQKVNDDNEKYQSIKTEIIQAKDYVQENVHKLGFAQEALDALNEAITDGTVVSGSLHDLITDADKSTADLTQQNTESKVNIKDLTKQNTEAEKNKAEFQKQVDDSRQSAEQSRKSAQDAGQSAQSAKGFADDAFNTADGFSKNTVPDAINDIRLEGNSQIDAVGRAGQSALNGITEGLEAVQNAGKQAVDDLTAEGTKQTNAVKSEGQAQTDNVKAEGQTQMGNLQTEIKDFRDFKGQVQGNTEDIMKLAIKPTVSGNPIVTKDSADFPLVSLELGGSTEQVVTSGKNLFDKTKVLSTDIITHNADGSFTVAGEGGQNAGNTKELMPNIKAGMTVYLQFKTTGKQKYMYLVSSASVVRANEPYVWKKEDEDSILYFYNGTISDIQFSESLAPYEPYTGGKPSPSPEYPQEVVNGKWDSVSDNGKNLFGGLDFAKKINEQSNKSVINEDEKTVTFDRKKANESGIVYENFEDNKTYSFQMTYKNTGLNASLAILYKDGTKSTFKMNASQKTTIALVDEKNIRALWITYYQDNLTTLYYEECGIFEGIVNVENFEPYKGFSESIEPITLSEWDTIKKVDGVWYKENNTNKMVFNKLWEFEGNRASVVLTDVLNISATEYSNFAFTNICKYNTQVADPNIEDEGFIVLKDRRMFFRNMKYLTLEDWNNYLSQNPMTVVYKIATPTYEPLPQPAQDLLNRIVTYYPNTVIQTNEGITLNLKYVADTKNYIDEQHKKDIAELQAMILER